VAGYGGHGIGSRMHMEPHILNYGRAGKGPRLHPGMALAIEPMITLGGRATRELSDGWTVSTADGSRSAHWEHTVAVLEDGPWVLTAEDGGRAELDKRGVQISAAATTDA
jgi:methionyl aminopeptidase